MTENKKEQYNLFRKSSVMGCDSKIIIVHIVMIEE